MQCDKCTLIYNRNNAVLYEPGTLKIRVTVTGQIYVYVFKRACSSGVCLLKPLDDTPKMLGSFSNAVSLTDNRFLMLLPICHY